MDYRTKGKMFIDKMENVPLSELSKFIPDNDKTKSALIQKLMTESNTSIETLAEYLDCKPQSLRNKIFRNSFSIDDLLIAAYACDFSIILKNNSNNMETVVDIVDFFKPLNDDVLVRISDIEQREKNAKRIEYDKLKADLEKIKNKYGFDD